MTKRIAVIINGIVDNVVSQPDQYSPQAGEIDVSTLPVGPGDTYDGVHFARAVVVYQWDALAFKRRLSSTERSAIRAGANPTGTDLQRAVNDFMDLLDTAASTQRDIYSNDPDVIAGMGLCEALGFIAPGRAAVILSGAQSP